MLPRAHDTPRTPADSFRLKVERIIGRIKVLLVLHYPTACKMIVFSVD